MQTDAAVQADRGAEDELFSERHTRLIYDLMLKVLRFYGHLSHMTEEDREDAFQIICIKLLKHCRKRRIRFEQIRTPHLYSIVRFGLVDWYRGSGKYLRASNTHIGNKCISIEGYNERRSQRINASASHSWHPSAFPGGTNDGLPGIPVCPITVMPSDELDAQDLLAFMEHRIDQFVERMGTHKVCSRAFRMYVEKGMSLKEIGKRLGYTESGVSLMLKWVRPYVAAAYASVSNR